jgi:hypothetical protein
MRLEYDKLLITFNPKYLEGRYYLQNNSGIVEIFVYVNLKIIVKGPVTVSFILFHSFVFFF